MLLEVYSNTCMVKNRIFLFLLIMTGVALYRIVGPDSALSFYCTCKSILLHEYVAGAAAQLVETSILFTL